MITEEEMRNWCIGQVQAIGTQRDAAQKLGISRQYLNMALLGHTSIASLANRLGWERVVKYRRKQSTDEKSK